MIYPAMAMVLLYYLFFIIYYQQLVPVKGGRALQIIITLLLVIASYVALNAWNQLLFNFPVTTLIMIVGLRFSTGMNWLQAFYGGACCTITAYCFRGIFTTISAFLCKGCDFLYNADAYYIITLFALPVSLLLLFVLRGTVLADNRLRRFLNNAGQLRLVIVYELAAVANLVVMNSGRNFSPNNIWYMGIALGNCTLTLFILIYVIYQSIKSTELLEYQWRTQVLEEQYDRQLQHYKSYQKYTESFRTFRHDYKSIMVTLKTLIRANDNEKAIQLIDAIYDDMQKKVRIHKKYSNNVILDAMLQDLANICEEKEIRFSFNVFAPRNTKLSLLDAIRIFSNIANNAVEACVKVPASDRFIEITSSNDQQWVTLEAVNSYDGKAIVENGELVTIKSEKHGHGLGLGIVKEIAENLGGFVIYDADSENKTFVIRIHVPYDQDKTPISF